MLAAGCCVELTQLGENSPPHRDDCPLEPDHTLWLRPRRQPHRLTYPDGKVVAYTYDTANRLIESQRVSESAIGQVQPVYNGVAQTVGATTTYFAYAAKKRAG